MIGDIFGRSWSSTVPAPAPAASSHLGIPSNNPNLFSDLVGSAIRHGRPSQNIPLKSTPPNNSFSMTGLSDSLPKTSKSTSSASNPSIDATGSFSSFNHSIGKTAGTASVASMKSMGGTTLNPKSEDPFGSLMGSVSKPSSSNVSISAGKSSINNKGSSDDPFGAFQNSPSIQKPQQSSNNNEYFGGFQSVKMNDFGIPVSSLRPQQKPTQGGVGVDPLDMLFPSSTSSTNAAGTSSGDQPIPEMNDWDVGAEFGGHETGGTTTELEGLPPPPAGVTVMLAKTKGLDSYKQGQFADAIKWLSWTVMLLEKLGDDSSSNEVLTCRASCYKEVGEYKKAIADCTKILEYDSTNVSVLLQRALLYESSEKYRLGAEDLRTVLKLDPGNRLAKSTIHRLNKFAD
ncbi:hypothetical protein HPP92_001904 [Vanilla planifolia]|uniref:Uncharacterized protein n=1 Tax=Vanilla planifolia TaxID=51239 RepID=A0A835VK39_VANPL|nr:hypothetical protein HPP92_001904 [Vanilla planifolia]